MIERVAARGLWQGALAGAGLAASLSLMMSLSWGPTEENLVAELALTFGAVGYFAAIGAFLGGLVGAGLGLAAGVVLVGLRRFLPDWASIAISVVAASTVVLLVAVVVGPDREMTLAWSPIVLLIAVGPMTWAVRRELVRAPSTAIGQTS